MSPVASATTLPLPNAPTQVTATPASATRITLNWQEKSQPGGLPISNYQVYQGTTPSQLAKIALTTSTTYNSQSLNPGTAYYFQIIAVDTGFDSSTPSALISVKTPPMPPAPTNLQATAPAANKISLTWQWTPATGGLPFLKFNVYCGTSPTAQTQIGTALAGQYVYTGVIPATQYYCSVAAVDSGFDNSLSSANVAISTPPMPNAPTNLIASSSSPNQVVVSWLETVPSKGLPIASYQIYRNTSLPVTTANYVGTRTMASYTDTNVSASQTYYYAIAAVDTGGDTSPLSVTVKITTPSH